MTKVQSKNAILFDIENDAGPLRGAMVETIGEGTTTEPGLISAADKTKLDGIAAGATVNAADASLRDRTTHTGEQAISTITGLATALAGKATPADVAAALAGLVDSSPGTLDTLNELAAALGDDPAFATTVSTALGNRLKVDAAQVLSDLQKAQGRDNLGLGSAALAASGDFATAAQGGKADQLPATLTASGLLASAGDGLSSAWLAYPEARQALDLAFVANYSMPLALNFYTLFIKATGSDDTGGEIDHGTTEATAFATSDAALLHAKKHLRFTGRLNVVMLKFANDAVRNFNLGSNLEQGDEGFPFTIGITSIDNADRAQFDSITTGSWRHVSVYVTQVELAYVTATRMNLVRVNDVTIRAKRDELNNPVSLPYGFYAAFSAYLHVFGEILVKEAVIYTSAFLYCQQHGAVMLENGDTPTIFPMVVLTNPGNVTSPYKYRAVLGGKIYAASNVYPQLTYASNFYVDAYSFSTQTQNAEDLGKNAASGGPCVADSGNTAAGWRIYADGYCEQWGNETLISLGTGRTNTAATITFAKELISPSYLVEGGTNNMDVRVGLHGTPLTTGFPLGAYNHNAANQNATARWRVAGYIA